ncbi:MAG: DNA repair protein RadA [Vicingaceae bacterium]
MAKIIKVFFCKNCGAESPKWMGKCSSCGEWNTYVEEIRQKGVSRSQIAGGSSGSVPIEIRAIESGFEERLVLPDEELNRVLGGGLVKGSLVLLGGEPGIGKSTLLLQIALAIKGKRSLYISGEESSQQIKMRGERLKNDENECLIFTETSIQKIIPQIEAVKPDLIVVDSVQTLVNEQVENAAGSVTQIRESTGDLLKLAKATGIPIFLVGHITKDGTIAGPKLLEHMVDVVLQFEGDRNHVFRIIRSLKNRYGSTNEIGIYKMNAGGLEAVLNPSEILISDLDEVLSGMAIASTMEGYRPLLIEVQALVSSAVYGTPQRSSTGFDARRLNMLLAVLEKRCGFRLSQKDVFLNIAGGIRVDDPAIDLAVVCSVLSSSEDQAIIRGTSFSAEIGLSGEIRPVARIDQRIDEAAKMGFERIFISKYNKGNFKSSKIEVIKLGRIDEVFRLLFS